MDQSANSIKNYGILASISWNSNGWVKGPTEEDLRKSNYGYVKENSKMQESLNFGHEILPAEKEGLYIGYTPMFNKPPDAIKSENVRILFFVSKDYKNAYRCIVGFYANPIILREYYIREAKHELFKEYDGGNVAAMPRDIIYFEHPIIIGDKNVNQSAMLPPGKFLSNMGFNYLDSDNVYNIISLALSINPTNKKLKEFVKRFPVNVDLINETIIFEKYLQNVYQKDADTLKSIRDLEIKMKRQTPEVKQRISGFIERGAIAKKIKHLNNNKCQICEYQGQNPFSFKKPDGTPYIEAHHVEPVSNLKEGSLSAANIITVCANHHRQLHFGNAYLELEEKDFFIFNIERKKIRVGKAQIN